MGNKVLTADQQQEIMTVLKNRFEKNMERHSELEWAPIHDKLIANPEKLWVLFEMERTEGEPDIIGFDEQTEQFIFCDCSAESPKGRRSVCYDHEALESRKQHKPQNSAKNMAMDMGVELLTEKQYRALQALGEFDKKTSSWVETPAHIRKLGGAIFCDRRYNTIFMYHNGAESYYAARGFRGILKI